MTDGQDEIQALRRTITRLERQNEQLRRLSTAPVLDIQRQAARLDELGLDLNALMARRGAAEFRATYRTIRRAYWLFRYHLPRRIKGLRSAP